MLNEDELAILGDSGDADEKKEANEVIVEYDEYEKQLMREISGLEEASLSRTQLELLNAQKDIVGADDETATGLAAGTASNLITAVQALLDFLDKSSDVFPAAKRATLAALQTQVRLFLTSEKTMIG